MLDIRLIRQKPDWVKERLATRGDGVESRIDEILQLDQQRRKWLSEAESLQAQRKRVSKEIGALMAQGKKEEAEARKAEGRRLGDRVEELNRRVRELEERQQELMAWIPNLPHESVPIGPDASGNVVVRQWGQPPSFSFEPRTHIELCESLGLIDFRRGAKITGSGFVLFTNWGARLERALIQFMLDLHTQEHGYIEVSPPYIIHRHCMFGVGVVWRR